MKDIQQLGISPAPWRVLNWRIFPNKIGVAAEGGWVVADVQVSQYGCCSTLGDRNARLIAAAPTLYEALASLRSCVLKVGWDKHWKDGELPSAEIQDAIRKADCALAAASGECEEGAVK